MRLIDAQCRPAFSSTGHLSFEIYVQISPTASGRGSAIGAMLTDGEDHSHSSPPPHESLKNYISFFKEEMRPLLLGSDFTSQQEVDSALFALFQRSKLPTTFFSATSIAFAKAASSDQGLPLHCYLKKLSSSCPQASPPIPIFDVLNATNCLYKSLHTIPFLLIPSSKLSLIEALIMGSRVLKKARELCWKDNRSCNTAHQGGVLTNLNNCEEGFSIVIKAASQCGYHAGEDFTLGIDFESEYFKTPKGVIFPWSEYPLSVEVRLSDLLKWVKKFPLSYVEDPFLNNETNIWRAFMQNVSYSTMLVGDKFFSTSLTETTCLERDMPINSFVLKPNQLPTVTEALNTAYAGFDLGWTPIVSYRTIDSDDTSLPHLAIASGAKYMKAGGMCNMEHVGKYNELMRIFNV